jgi:hypothetical protein
MRFAPRSSLESHAPDELFSIRSYVAQTHRDDVRAGNPNGIPSLSPGLTRNAGLPWVIVPRNNSQPQRGCSTRARCRCHAIQPFQG